MITTNELTANAYLKLRDKVAEALCGREGAATYYHEYAENLIRAGYINIEKVLDLPRD